MTGDDAATTLVDTSVLIDVLRGSALAAQWLAARETAPLCSELTRVEVLRGLRSAERSATRRLLDLLRWVPVDGVVSACAGDLGRRYRRSYQGLGTVDLVVAASAIVHGAELATGNVKHFPMFEGLRPPYPVSPSG